MGRPVGLNPDLALTTSAPDGRGRGNVRWFGDSWGVQVLNPELWRFTLKVMRDGRPVTVEVTPDGAGLVSHAGSALLAQVGGQARAVASAVACGSAA